MKNVLAVQEAIARAIVQALRVQLGGKSGPLVRPGTSDTAAYGLYLQARSLMHTTPTTVNSDSAIAAFNGAIARDPSFAQAFAGLADAYLLRSIFRGRPPLEDLPHAKNAAEKALGLDSTIAEAHVALASVLFGFDWDWQAAEREFDTAFALDPGYADGSFRYGICRQSEATAVLTDLVASSSRRYVPPVGIAVAYVGLNNADSAFRWLDKGYRDHAAFMDGLKTIVAFEPLHDDSRWERLLRRMGLADSVLR